jgi:hypothetical protein
MASHKASLQLGPQNQSSWAAQTPVHLANPLACQQRVSAISPLRELECLFTMLIAEFGSDLLGLESSENKETYYYALLELGLRVRSTSDIRL